MLITGAAGSLAQRVIARLHSQCRIIATDFRRRVATDSDVASYQVDMQEGGFESLFRRQRIDAVLHLGRIFPHQSTRVRRYSANVLGTRRLLELCRKYKVGQVLIHSSHFVYGASPHNPALLDEDTPLKAGEITRDLIDAVELENLAQIWLWKHPEIRIGILRPCNILGPGVRNSLSLLMARRFAPCLAGHSPKMQFLHVDDMAEAIGQAYEQRAHGVYNVATDRYISYRRALRLAGCSPVPLPPVPGQASLALNVALSRMAGLSPHLINYFKYPVLLDGRLFAGRFGWRPQHRAEEALAYYRRRKQRGADGEAY